MKLSTSLFVIASAASASAEMIRSASLKRALLSEARRLTDDASAGDDFVANNAYGFLSKYDLLLLTCESGEQYTDANGNVEYSSVVFRLCPADSCNSDTVSGGCKSGYGDYVVGLNTYTTLWLEDKRNDWNNDDNLKIEDYAECRQYDFRDGQNDDQTVYYVGPTCSSTSDGIMLGFFTDASCTTVSTTSFEDKSGGWSLPYTSSELVTNACEACAGYNNNGQYAVSDLCTYLWEDASSKCETNMAVVYSSGADTTGCDTISALLPQAAKTGHAGAAIGWTFFVLVILGAAGYAYATWWMKRKQSTSGMASDGVMN